MASVLYLLSQGVQIFRVHNVLEIKQGILVFGKISSEASSTSGIKTNFLNRAPGWGTCKSGVSIKLSLKIIISISIVRG